MSSLVFIADDSTQSTTTTISGASTYIPVYAYNTSLSCLSSYGYLSINNLDNKIVFIRSSRKSSWI